MGQIDLFLQVLTSGSKTVINLWSIYQFEDSKNIEEKRKEKKG